MAADLRHGSTITVYASTARTATPPPVEFNIIDPAVRGIIITVNKTAHATTPSVVPTLKILVAGSWITLKLFTAITTGANGLYVHFVYPGITDLGIADIVRDEVLAYPIATKFEFSMVHATGAPDSLTYSVELQCLR